MEQLNQEAVKWIMAAMGAIIILWSAYKALKGIFTEIISSSMDVKLAKMSTDLDNGLANIRSAIDLREEKQRNSFDEKLHMNMSTIGHRIDQVLRDFAAMDKSYTKEFAETKTDLRNTKNYQKDIMERIDRFEQDVKSMFMEHSRKVDDALETARNAIDASRKAS